MMIRLASEADLEAMTAVLIGASALDPVYPYRFPDRHLYPDEFAALCRRKCSEYLDSSTVVVCEMPVDDAYGSPTQVVAFSAWDMPSAADPACQSRRDSAVVLVEPTSPTSPTFPSPPTTIGNVTRQSAFRAALAKHKTEFFDARFGGGQQQHVFLKILLCHPTHQRRGAGTALTVWGIEQARRLGVHTTVFASPMGLRLYQKLGFREVGRFTVQLEGEGEFLEIPALALGPGLVGGMREAADGGGAGLGLCGLRVGDCPGGGGGGWSGAVCA
ncbi:putative N-acetyltransferase ycf52-like protein [Chaetomidium leptoderma]|uniref:N-acetyltransferase ycf52-like protein n=1 Tax=Chaetomidium leptoderma TaxID=669021 RepID=A0AAN6VS01_9PEZI|nr:putative N-acetyltransferase ycf52-like protein [Chaetomidium leptoderma]